MSIMNDIWNWISQNVNGILLGIILFLLGLDTIRMIINITGIVDEDVPFGRIIYGKKRPVTIKAALKELGYTERKSDDINVELSFKAVTKRLAHKDDEWCYRKLIMLIKDCMVECNSEVSYGNNITEYYIDTMSGVHDRENRKIMRDLILYLLKTRGKLRPRFVVTPKSGNPMLGTSIASSLGIPILLHKYEKDPSRVMTIDTESEAHTAQARFNVNFEGASTLNVNKKLEGIFIDCNTSGGSLIVSAGREFEELITLQGAKDGNCPTVKHAFVLFRVDDDSPYDERFKEAGIELNCILMLSEDIKNKIFELSEKPSATDINSIIADLRQKNYLLLHPLSAGKQKNPEGMNDINEK
jgi:hypothetical protein